MKNKIKSFFKSNPSRTFKNKEVAKRLKIKSEVDYKTLKSTLHRLALEKYLLKEGKRYRLNSIPESNRIVGYFQLNEGGFGFVVPKSPDISDIYISARDSSNAFHGDLVEVMVFAKQKGKNLEGEITKVIKRKKKQFVGQLRRSRSFYFVSPDDTKIHRDIYIDAEDLSGAKPGDKVSIGKIKWDDRMLHPQGEVIEVLGEEGTLNAEIKSIAREFGISSLFKKTLIREAEKIEKEVTNEEIIKRLDFRKKNVFTIDPKDAKDFDDALSAEKLKNGHYKVGVHIADVSYYVKPDSALDTEALTRGNSTYLVGKAIPMLPEILSNNICSLIPNEDRLTFSVIFEITGNGRVVDYRLAKTIINSKMRFTYEDVQKIIESGKGELFEDIKILNDIAKILRKRRFTEGSLEFFTPEVEFELNSDGIPVSITKKEIKQSNMLVEEFMLLANKSVAEKISRIKKTPFVYRVHDLPDQEKIKEFSRFVKSLGYNFNPGALKNAAQFNKLMESAIGTEEEGVINELAIRSMAKAIYSPHNIGHYGLGFNFYTHFTSPIRRYSDLIVHRIAEKTINNKSGIYYSLEDLVEICEHISTTERNSMEAERYSVKKKQVEFLQKMIGNEFQAVISGVANFGIFVELTDYLAQGLVKVKDLEGDFYVLSDKKYSLIGDRTKKEYRLGDRICVKLVRADLDSLELDFIINECR